MSMQGDGWRLMRIRLRVKGGICPRQRIVGPTKRHRKFARKPLARGGPSPSSNCPIDSHGPPRRKFPVIRSQREIVAGSTVVNADREFAFSAGVEGLGIFSVD